MAENERGLTAGLTGGVEGHYARGMRMGFLIAWLALGLSSMPGARAAQLLNVFIWSEYLDPEIVKDFERQFDAKVTVDLYEDSESMLAKLQAGGSSYDIVVPPDHTVPGMIKLGLLTPLRAANLPNLRNLDPKFARPPFDPGNGYTVAYQWGTMGLLYRRQAGRPAPVSWGSVLDPAAQPGPMVLIDSMRDAIGLALKYRGQSLNSTDPAQLKEVRELLVSAKKRSAALEGSVGGKNRVLGKSAELAVVYSAEASRALAEDKETGYVIPQEGSQIWVDNLAIPAKAPHRDLAEKFINFILDAKVGGRVANFTGAATPNAAARAYVRPEDLKNPVIYPPAELMPKLEFLQDLGAKARLYDQIWTQVKAR